MWKEYTHVSEERTSTIYKVEDPLLEDEDNISLWNVQVNSSQTTRLRISNLTFTAVKTSDLAFYISCLFFVNIIV